MKRYLIPTVVLALFIGFCVYWFSPRQIIQRRTKSLLSTLTLEKGSGMAGRNARTYELHDLLSSEVTLTNPTIPEANGSFARDEMEAAFSWLCNQAKETRFELEDIHDITIQDDTATVKLVLFGLVELPVYRPADGRYEVTFDWAKEKDGWKLTRAVWDKQP